MNRQAKSSYSIPVRVPYRLDLTVSVLRRLSTNLVDVLDLDGAYVRVLAEGTPVVVCVRQVNARTLTVGIEGDGREHPPLLGLVRRILGVDVDLARFYRSASRIRWLHPLALRMRGVKPPRHPTLWEACVNAIVFQQVSVVAASAIMRRFIVALGEPLEHYGAQLYCFPSAASLLGARDARLRAAGLSAEKLATLRRVADALGRGALNEAMLDERPSPDAAALLCSIRGIGPWTAAVILLRGLGRLDVFPTNDSSVARNLALIGGAAPLGVEEALDALGPQRGMLYYHLLLARLEARDELGRPSYERGRERLAAPSPERRSFLGRSGR
jgi:DNA-3-methyladenine glycosylase II